MIIWMFYLFVPIFVRKGEIFPGGIRRMSINDTQLPDFPRPNPHSAYISRILTAMGSGVSDRLSGRAISRYSGYCV